tara:strand:+ start:1022 stop:2593 length:1572 start_codon:yes stop_codon:yes gene_type:complete
MAKKYDSGSSLQEKVLKGVDILADNVASTLGPRGRNVILHQKGSNPIITKDGVTISKFVDLKDPFENAGAQIIKQVASRTADECGDGTTTSTVLARAVLREAQKYIVAGSSPVEIKRGMDKAVEAIVEHLEAMSEPISSVEDIEHIATISANGDKMVGKLIASAVDAAGKDGSITIEEARSVETSLDLVEGFRFDSGYVSPQFITDERRGAVKYSDPLILVTDYDIETVDQLLPILEVVSRENRPFVIVCENIEGQALAAVIMNAIRGTLKVAAVKAPRYGEERRGVLKDLAVSIGAHFVSRNSGVKLQETKLVHLGTAKTIDILKNSTTIVGGNGDPEEVDKKIEALKTELEQTDSLHECEKLQERVTRLASGVAIIRVGGLTEIEMIEKRHRVEDALEAVRSGQLEGIVPGGGVALVRAAANLEVDLENEDQETGARIVCEAVKAPIKQMALNAGDPADLILHEILSLKGSDGRDFTTGEIVNMIDKGIIDPAKVTKTALQNAVSAASTLITTNFAIVESD